MTADHGKRKSSTKGRHIKQINPLAKGKSCLTCRQRKVRCTAERPACQACLRTARFEGRDLSTVQCAYNENPTPRGRRGKGKGAKESVEEPTTTDASGSERLAAKGTMSDLLNGTSYAETAAAITYASLPAMRVPTQSGSQSNPLSTVPWNAWPLTNSKSSTATPQEGMPHSYSTTPPLVYSTASSPTETTFSSPPTPTTSPAPTSIVQPVSSTSAYVPYFHQHPSTYSHNAYYPNPLSTLPYPYSHATAPDYSTNFIPMRISTNDSIKFSSYSHQPQYNASPGNLLGNSLSHATSAYPPPQQFSPSDFPPPREKSNPSSLSALSSSLFPPPFYSTYPSNPSSASSLPAPNLPRLENVAPQSTFSQGYSLMPQNR